MSAHVLPARLDAEQAERRVRGYLPGARRIWSRLLHHPYGGFVFHVQQWAFGSAMRGEVPVMVDLRSGSVATSDPWPSPTPLEGKEHLKALDPLLDPEEAGRQARQCVVRTVLHRRLSLRRPRIQLSTTVTPLYKPNWLLLLRTEASDGRIGVLVDALTGNYHTVDIPPNG